MKDGTCSLFSLNLSSFPFFPSYFLAFPFCFVTGGPSPRGHGYKTPLIGCIYGAFSSSRWFQARRKTALPTAAGLHSRWGAGGLRLSASEGGYCRGNGAVKETVRGHVQLKGCGCRHAGQAVTREGFRHQDGHDAGCFGFPRWGRVGGPTVLESSVALPVPAIRGHQHRYWLSGDPLGFLILRCLLWWRQVQAKSNCQ